MKIAIIDDGINQNYFAQRIYQKVDFSSGVSQNGEDSRHGNNLQRKLSDKFVEKLIL